jgi:serine/threonine protein kinase
LGILEKGGLWIELKGIANARSLNREIFGRVSRFFDVMIRAAEILQAIHAHGVVHGDVKPANILINDQQEIEWIDFEKGMFSEGFSPLDENQQPIIENQGKDTDTFSFIMTLASIMGELMRGSAVSDEMKPMFLKMRDGYLDMIFKRLPQNASYLNSVESLYTSQDAFIQKRRHQWPKKMEIILQKLRSDRELFQSRRR